MMRALIGAKDPEDLWWKVKNDEEQDFQIMTQEE